MTAGNLYGEKNTKGDLIIMAEAGNKRSFTAAVVTLSDKGSRGERVDTGGDLVESMLKEAGYEVIERILLPDGIEPLAGELCRLADEVKVNLVITTGGTGFSERDLTPEATIKASDRMAPGIAEAMRYYSLSITPKGMLSRAASGIRKKTLIVNLPGSPKAIRENLEYILPPLDHGLGILLGIDGECGAPAN